MLLHIYCYLHWGFATENKEIVPKLLLRRRSQLLDAIKSSHVIINEHIKFQILISHFNHYGIFTRDEVKCFSTESISDTDKGNNLIEWLSRKDENGIHSFVRALSEAHEHSGHLAILKHLYDILYPQTEV